MNKLIIAVLIIFFPFIAHGGCSDFNDMSSQCRYTRGDNWCAKKYDKKIYAYKNKCEEQKSNQNFYHSCGTGCAMQYRQKQLNIKSKENVESELQTTILVYGEQADSFIVNYTIQCDNNNLKNMMDSEGISVMDIAIDSISSVFSRYGEYVCRETFKHRQ